MKSNFDKFYLGVDADKLDATVQIYTEILGMIQQTDYAERRHPDSIVLLDGNAGLFELYPLDPHQIYDDLGNLYLGPFKVDDVDASYQRVVELGMKIFQERKLAPNGWYKFDFYCPDGVEITLFNNRVKQS
jgi:predicted enzyme related to lactoylglutathione lyase